MLVILIFVIRLIDFNIKEYYNAKFSLVFVTLASKFKFIWKFMVLPI